MGGKTIDDKVVARATFARAFELTEKPIKGSFDVGHLKSIHQYVFQDLPSLGVKNLTPGKLRDPVPSMVTGGKIAKLFH